MTSHRIRMSAASAAASAAMLSGLVAAPAGAALAAEATGSSLCAIVDVEAINAIGPLEYAVPDFASPSLCALESATDGGSLILAITGIDFDTMASTTPEIEVGTVAGQPAFFLDGSLHVDVGEGVLTIAPQAGLDGFDPEAYARSVAELAVPPIMAMGAPDPGDRSSGATLDLPDVEGIEWGRNGGFMTIAQLIEQSDEQRDAFQPLVDALGVGADQVSLLSLSVRDEASGDDIGSFGAIRVESIDPTALGPAINEWLRVARGTDDVVQEPKTIGGCDVTELIVDGESRGYLYLAGDTAYAIAMDEDRAAEVLASLP